MATSIIKNIKPTIRTISIAYSIAANGNFNTNLKTLIDNDMPSGYMYGGIGGWTTNSNNVFMNSCNYGDSAYSFQLGSMAAASGNALVSYMAVPK